MEVSYTDHSHIIGRGGNTISRVMEETRCHVHFPDSNRTNQTEKSNLVTVAGELTGVEMARARIRVITPIKLILLYLVSLSCWQIWRVLFWRRLCNRILDQLTTMLGNSGIRKKVYRETSMFVLRDSVIGAKQLAIFQNCSSASRGRVYLPPAPPTVQWRKVMQKGALKVDRRQKCRKWYSFKLEQIIIGQATQAKIATIYVVPPSIRPFLTCLWGIVWRLTD